MKKITIFLLTCLLLVGFSNVFAQTRASVDVQSTTPYDLYCSNGDSILLEFSVIPDAGGQTNTPVKDHFIYITADPDLRANWSDGNFEGWDTIREPDMNIFYPGNMFQYWMPAFSYAMDTTYYVCAQVIVQRGSVDVLLPPDNRLEVNVYYPPTLQLNPNELIGIMCEGGSVDIEASVTFNNDNVVLHTLYDNILYEWKDTCSSPLTVTPSATGVVILGDTINFTLQNLAACDHQFIYTVNVVLEYDTDDNPTFAPSCMASDTIDFTVVPQPEAVIFWPNTPLAIDPNHGNGDIYMVCETEQDFDIGMGHHFSESDITCDFALIYTLEQLGPNDTTIVYAHRDTIAHGSYIFPQIATIGVAANNLDCGLYEYVLSVQVDNLDSCGGKEVNVTAGCIGTDTLSVYVYKNIVADIPADSVSMCGDVTTVTLTAAEILDPTDDCHEFVEGVWTVVSTSGTYDLGDISFDPATADTSEVVVTFTVPVVGTEEFQFVWTVTNGACETTDTVLVIVHEKPALTLESHPGNPICDESPFDIEVSVGYPNGTFTDGEPFDYDWVLSDGLVGTVDDIDSSIFHVTENLVSGTLTLTVTDVFGCSVDTTFIVHPLPNVTPIEADVLACCNQLATLSFDITPLEDTINGVHTYTINWDKEIYYTADYGTGTPDPLVATTTSLPVLGLCAGIDSVVYTVTIEDDITGCEKIITYIQLPEENPIDSIEIALIPDPLCNNSMVTLNAELFYNPPYNADNTTQTYEWYMQTFATCPALGYTPTPDEFTSIGVTDLNLTYKIEIDDTQYGAVMFMLMVNTEGFNCPTFEFSNCVTILPSIKVDGGGNDTICHGGSVPIRFDLSNYRPVTQNDRIYYRIYENNLYFDDIYDVYTLDMGLTYIEFTTHPSLHTTQNGPESYCYTVEVWQGTNVPGGVPNPFDPAYCHTFSECHNVTVLKDPTVTISGPTTVMKGTTDYPVFTANVMGGTGEITYQWYLNGNLVEGATNRDFMVDDQNVINNTGSYDVAVQVYQATSGCDAPYTVHPFEVICMTGTVTIEGPTAACVGDVITLTAVVVSDASEYLIKWKRGGNYLPTDNCNCSVDASGLNLYLTVTEPVDIADYQVEVSFCGCEIVLSPVHYFQVLPKTVVLVDDYIICANGAVDVEATLITFGNAELYRYEWYNDTAATTPFDITYVNHRLFTFDELAGDTTTFYVKAQMLNAICSSDMAAFDIIVQGALTPVTILPADTITCVGTQVYFGLGQDDNIAQFGTPDVSWWLNGIEIPGEELNYINIHFHTVGTHYVYARLTYPGNTCEFVTYQVAIEVREINGVTIDGPSVVCNTENPTVLQAIVDPMSSATITYKYQWYQNGTAVGTAQTQTVSNDPSPYPYIYWVVVTDTASGCTAQSLPFEVTVNAYSNIAVTVDKLEGCPGTAFTFTAHIEEYVNWTYQWYRDGMPIAGAEYLILTDNPDAGVHEYYFVATQIVSECTATSNTVTITVNQIPAVPVLTVSDNMICSGNPVTISGTPEGGIYHWNRNGFPYPYVGAQSTIIDQPTANNIVTPYTYSAYVTVGGCTSEESAPITVLVHPAISVNLFGAHDVCEQATFGEHLALHAEINGLQPNVSYKYEWFYRQGNNPAVNFYTEFDSEGEYAEVPNNLPVNDHAAPYCFTVEVTVMEYECTATSPCHEVTVWAKPAVQISLSAENVCPDGTITATAHATPAPTPENPYNYIWTVNGVTLPNTQSVVTIGGNWLTGVNEICVTIERAYASLSCVGSTCKLVNVVTEPSIVLTHNINGLDLPGMCVGGTVNLFAEIVDFDITLVNPAGFTYEWILDGTPIPGNFNFNSYTLNNPGTYTFGVRAVSANNALGCNTEWVFTTVKVVPQPTVNIYPKDYNLYDVCVGAVIEINTTLGPIGLDPTIQGGYQYKWNDLGEWTNFTNQIDPRSIEFNTPGSHTFFLNATFENPTCNATQSNLLTYKVVSDPAWTATDVTPNELCLGEVVTMHAEFIGGVTDGTNHGRIQWMVQFDPEEYVNIQGVGGDKTHKPAQAGEYYYMVNYIPVHELSGCNIDPEIFGPIVVNETMTPSATFINENQPEHTCASTQLAQPVELIVGFTGTPPFNFHVVGTPGNFDRHFVSYADVFSFTVTPTVTTTYTIESLDEETECMTGTFVKSSIMVVVTDVQILTPHLEACGGIAEVTLQLNSYFSTDVTVTFPCGAPIQVPIVQSGSNTTITIPIPDCLPVGVHNVTLTIDGCDFNITIMNNTDADGNEVHQLIHRRWENNAEVLAVSNNHDPDAKYYNGGFDFVAFQWYKNGVMIPGATKQYYQDPDGVNGLYSVRLNGYRVDADGNRIGDLIEFSTCDKPFNPSLSMKVYPVPARVDEPVYVDIDLTPAEMEGATLDIYDAKGAHIQHIRVVSSVTEVTGFKAQGAYYGKITTGTNEIKAVKFVIVK